MSLQRVPPNLLVGDGARDFAGWNGIPILPHDFLISESAKERWKRWREDLRRAEADEAAEKSTPPPASSRWDRTGEPMMVEDKYSPPKTPQSDNRPLTLSDLPTPARPLQASSADLPTLRTFDDNADSGEPRHLGFSGAQTAHIHANGVQENYFEPSQNASSPSSRHVKRQRTDGSVDEGDREDDITDTVGAIAVDCFGNIAAGSSSGGIGMKHHGRCGPAALVGIGTAVRPADSHDPSKTCVATVTSGTGEHMATTMAAATVADRIYASVRKKRDGPGLQSCDEDEAMASMINEEFMKHPGVRNSHCAGAIGVMAVKKTKDGIYLYFGHNTDSFALASFHSEEKKTTCVMSRSSGNAALAQGGRAMHSRKKR